MANHDIPFLNFWKLALVALGFLKVASALDTEGGPVAMNPLEFSPARLHGSPAQPFSGDSLDHFPKILFSFTDGVSVYLGRVGMALL